MVTPVQRNRHTDAGEGQVDELARSLYHRHGTALEDWARRRFADGLAAEEVVQEIVLLAWRKHGQFDPARGSERAWMFGIAKNVAASRHRRDARRLWVVPAAEPEPEPEEDADLARLAERSLVADALASLSDDHRAVVVAAYWDGLTTRQIAARLGVADGTVKSRLHYALRALRLALEEREILS